MKYFSVTKVLSPFVDFSMIPPDVLDFASERGTLVHRYCETIARGIPAMGIPEYCAGYVRSFQRWFDEYVLKVIFVEHEMIDDGFGYLGHVDLVCVLKDLRAVVVDLKTPLAESPTWRAQLAAYRQLAVAETQKRGLRYRIPEKNGCMALRLHPKGGAAKAIIYEWAGRDFQVFLSALNAYRNLTK
jgi:hypothetical protein